jgi:peptide/nickel transport system permease protein
VFGLKWLPGTSSMSGGFEFKQLDFARYGVDCIRFWLCGPHDPGIHGGGDDLPVHPDGGAQGPAVQKVIIKHALRNALIAPFTVIMLQINWLLSGVIVVEFFFAYKGFGALILEASLNNDIALWRPVPWWRFVLPSRLRPSPISATPS